MADGFKELNDTIDNKPINDTTDSLNRLKNAFSETSKAVSTNAREIAMNLKKAFDETYLTGLVEQYQELEQRMDAYRQRVSDLTKEEQRLAEARKDLAKGGLKDEDRGMYNALGRRIIEIKNLRNQLNDAYDASFKQQQGIESKIIKYANRMPEERKPRSTGDAEERFYQARKELQKTQGNLINSQDIDGDIAKIKSLESELKNLQGILEKAGVTLYPKQAEQTPLGGKDVAGEIERLKGELAQKKATLPISADASQALTEINDIESRIKQLEKIQIRIDDTGNIDERIQSLQTLIDNLKSQDRTLGITEQIKDAEAEMERLKEKKQEIESQQPQPQKLTYGDVEKRLKELPKQIEEERGKIDSADNIEEQIKKVKELEAEYQRLKQIKETADTGYTNAPPQGKESRGETVRETTHSREGSLLGSAISASGSAIKATFADAKGVIDTASSAFDSLKQRASSALSTISSLGSKAFGALKSGVHSAISGVKSLIGKFKSLGGGTTKNLLKSFSSIKSMLKRRLKRTFISGIFNDIKSNMGVLAKYDKEFNSAMTGITTASKTLKASLTTTFASLISIIAPTLTTILNYVNTFVNSINAAIAALTGKTSYKKAIVANEDYAKSANKASGAQKDLNKQLYGFDELTRQEDSSGSGSTTKYEDAKVEDALSDTWQSIVDAIKNGKWEEAGELLGNALNGVIQKIDDFIVDLRPKAVEVSKNIANFLNGLVNGLDWTLIGKTIGDGLNLVFDTINTFLTTFNFENLGSKLAESVNSIFDTVEWDLVGQTFANYFNAIFDTIKGFVTNANWKKYGKSLATAVTNFFKTIKWDSIRTTFAQGINGVTDMLYEFVTNVDWDGISQDLFNCISGIITDIDWNKISNLLSTSVNNLIKIFKNFVNSDILTNLGTNLGKLLGDAIANINWEELGTTLATGVNTLGQSLLNFVTNLNLAQIGSSIATGLQSTLSNIDWDNLATMLSTSVNGLISGFKNLSTGVDWVGIATSIFTAISNLINEINWTELSELISNKVNNLVGVVKAFFESGILGDLGTSLSGAINQLVQDINWEELGATVGQGISDLKNAIWGFLANIDWTELGTNIGEAVNNLFANIDFAGWASNISQTIIGVFNGISALLQEVDWQQIGNDVAEFLGSIDWGGIVSSLVGALGTALGGLAELIWGLIEDAWNSVVEWWNTKMEESGGNVIQALFNGIIEILTNVGTWIHENIIQPFVRGLESALGLEEGTIGQAAATLWENFKTGVLNAWQALKDFVTNVWDGFSTWISETWESAKTGVSEFFSGMWDSIKDAVKGVATWASDIWTGFKEWVSTTWNTASTAVGEFFSTMWNGIKEKVQGVKQWASDIWIGFKDWVSTTWNTASVAVGEFFSGMWDGIKEKVQGVKQWASDIWDGFKDWVSTTWNTASTAVGEFFSGMWDGIKNKIQGVKQWASNIWTGFKEWVSTTWDTASTDVGKFFSGMWNGIKEKIGAVKDFAGNIWEGFKEWVESTWDTISSSVSEFFTGVWDGIKGAFGTLGDTATNIWNGFLDGVTNAWNTVKDAVVGVFTGAWDAIKGAFTGIGDFCKSIWDGIVQGFTDWWTNLKESLLKPFKDLWQAILDFFGIHSPSTKADEEIGQNILLGLVQGFESIVDTICESVKRIFGKIWDAILSIFGLGQKSEEQKSGEQAGKDIMNGIKDGMTGNEEPAKKAAREAAAHVLEEMRKALGINNEGEASTKTNDFGDGVVKGIAKGIEDHTNQSQYHDAMQAVLKGVRDEFWWAFDIKPDGKSYKFSDAGKAIILGLAQGIVDNIDSFNDAAEKVATKISDETFSEGVGSKVSETMISGMVSKFEDDTTAETSADAFGKRVVKAVEDVVTKDSASEFTKSFIDGMQEALEKDTTVRGTTGEMASFAKDVKKQFSDQITEADGKALGTEYIKGISSGVKDEFNGNLKVEAQDVGVDTVEEIKDRVNHSEGYDMAYYIMDGLADGLSGNRNAVVRWAAVIADDLVNTFKGKLGISSPSKVFASLGDFTMQGLDNGLAGRGQNVISTVSDLANAITKEGKNLNLESEVDVMTSGLDTVADKMSRIAQIFTNIGETISRMGQLEVPAIASGQVIPYKARVETTQVPVQNGMLEGHNFEDALYNAFTRAMGSPEGQQEVNITLQIDGRKMADIVSKYQRQQSRAWGV